MGGFERVRHRRGGLYYLDERGRGLERLHSAGDVGRESEAVHDVN